MSEIDLFLSIVLIGCMILLLQCRIEKNEGFSLSKKPMHTENSLLHFSPIDDIDYITPVFLKMPMRDYLPQTTGFKDRDLSKLMSK